MSPAVGLGGALLLLLLVQGGLGVPGVLAVVVLVAFLEPAALVAAQAPGLVPLQLRQLLLLLNALQLDLLVSLLLQPH